MTTVLILCRFAKFLTISKCLLVTPIVFIEFKSKATMKYMHASKSNKNLIKKVKCQEIWLSTSESGRQKIWAQNARLKASCWNSQAKLAFPFHLIFTYLVSHLLMELQLPAHDSLGDAGWRKRGGGLLHLVSDAAFGSAWSRKKNCEPKKDRKALHGGKNRRTNVSKP